jgi:FkbM family methyltransferase
MKLNKINVYIKQLGYRGAIPLFLLDLVRRAFGQHSRLSYAQVGEDMILNWFFPSNEGFYVEVGCNHPKAYSNTFNLYKKGWRGICIDANESLIREYKRYRKEDISICAAISDREQEVVFTEFDDTLISSLDVAHVANWIEMRPVKCERILTTRTLDNVLHGFNPPNDFDLLSIDVEGHDYEVLLSINLNRYRPKLILIEMHGFDISNPDVNKTYSYLVSMNYRMVGYLIMNGYFVRNNIT